MLRHQRSLIRHHFIKEDMVLLKEITSILSHNMLLWKTLNHKQWSQSKKQRLQNSRHRKLSLKVTLLKKQTPRKTANPHRMNQKKDIMVSMLKQKRASISRLMKMEKVNHHRLVKGVKDIIPEDHHHQEEDHPIKTMTTIARITLQTFWDPSRMKSNIEELVKIEKTEWVIGLIDRLMRIEMVWLCYRTSLEDQWVTNELMFSKSS